MRSNSKAGATSGSSPSMDELDNVPLYLRVTHSLRSRISSGEWPTGTQLPTIKDLAAEYDVALITIRQAVKLLAADKLLVSQRGRGTFVSSHTKDLASNTALREAINDRLNLPPNCTIKVLERYTVESLPTSIVPADVKKHPKYNVIEKLHLEDGTPFAFMTLYVEKSISDKFPRKGDEKSKILKLILRQGPLKLASNNVQIVLQYANDQLAKLLECQPLSALVRIRTVRRDADDTVVLVTDAYYRGDKFLYEIEEKDLELSGTSPMVLPDLKH